MNIDASLLSELAEISKLVNDAPSIGVLSTISGRARGGARSTRSRSNRVTDGARDAVLAREPIDERPEAHALYVPSECDSFGAATRGSCFSQRPLCPAIPH